MAFTVTPTSGDAPYSLSATVDNSVNVDGVNYVASVTTEHAMGSCPLSGAGTPLTPTIVNSLINGETVVSGAPTVTAGRCRTYTLAITRLSDNVVVDSADAFVDNI